MRESLQTASSWFLRRDAGDLSSADESSLRAWLAASEQNRIAYELVQSTWQAFDAPMHHAELEALRVDALAASPRRRIRPLMAAAIVVAIILPTLAVLIDWSGPRPAGSIAAGPPAIQHFAGAPEHISTVALSDGTTVYLTFDADMIVKFTASERRVVLTQGEAFFEVSKNPQRPFMVEAGDKQILAVGTQFDVRLEPDRVEVVLLEGKVSVRDSRNARVGMSPGQRLIAANGEPSLISGADAQRLTSWRHGWITFENESLADAVAEFNRYSAGPPIVTDPQAGSLRLGGVFRLGRPDRFAALVEELLPVSVVVDSAGKIHLVPSKARGQIGR